MTRHCLVLAIATFGIVAGSAASADSPPARAHHALVYDAARGRVLLTAGSTPRDGGQRFEFFDDLWAFDSCGWHRLGSSGAAVSGVALATDPGRGRLLSFGGFDGRSLGELRSLEGDRWTTLGRLDSMPVAEPGFVYDAARARFVAFGGSAGRGSVAGETWEYHGAGWSRVDGPGPPPRQAHVMVYDARRRRTVVFGGMSPGPAGQRPTALGDTWEFDGRRWRRHQGEAPSPRHGAGAAFDAKRGVLVVFGGAGPDGFLGDTWEWNGTTWRRRADAGPAPRAMGMLAYDARRDRVVLFGGRKGWPDGDLGDTWEWDGIAWREATPPECPGR